MIRGPTFSELAWPDDPDNADLPLEWARNATTQVLDWTWRAFDQLYRNHLSQIDLAQPLEQLERDLTRNHFVEILAIFGEDTDGFSTLIPVHEWPEMETRSPPPARPPAYDLGFVYLANRRWAWPIEAKVLRTATSLSEYLADVRDKFIGGVAAPFVGEGGMIGYLLTGLPDTCFANLEKLLSCSLLVVPEFASRPHRASSHERTDVPPLRLHHMLMPCS